MSVCSGELPGTDHHEHQGDDRHDSEHFAAVVPQEAPKTTRPPTPVRSPQEPQATYPLSPTTFSLKPLRPLRPNST